MNFQNLQQKESYVINSLIVRKYSHHEPIKFLTDSLELGLCNYSDAYAVVTGHTAVNNADDADLDRAQLIKIVMPICTI